ncbi:MAG: cytidylate kinase-like family protein [Acidobacteriota bacterium]|nr:cytidylate kinase-like family protein [Acidobacteriota bacterium]
MIKVITLEREYGSGGGGIAKQLADKLGWQLWDRQVTCEIASRLKCDIRAVEQREERCDTTFYRLMKTFMRGSYEDQLGGSGVELLDADRLAAMFEKIVIDLASKGNCVIVGRGSTWFLRDNPDAFHVFLYAPHEEKMRRIKASGNSQSEAEELIERVDRERATFVKKYYNKNWPQRDLYHMMLNTKVGDERVVRLILEEIAMLSEQPVTPWQKAG